MHGQALPKSRRLIFRKQFLRLFEDPHVYRAGLLQIFWKENDLKISRIGITIKGRLGNVWRTRIKRIIREYFRIRVASDRPIDVNFVIKVPDGKKPIDWNFVDELKQKLESWKQ